VHYGNAGIAVNLDETVDHLRAVLGDALFDECVAVGATMDLGDAVAYARHQIQAARREMAADT
jgi:hypothetical protein